MGRQEHQADKGRGHVEGRRDRQVFGRGTLAGSEQVEETLSPGASGYACASAIPTKRREFSWPSATTSRSSVRRRFATRS